MTTNLSSLHTLTPQCKLLFKWTCLSRQHNSLTLTQCFMFRVWVWFLHYLLHFYSSSSKVDPLSINWVCCPCCTDTVIVIVITIIFDLALKTNFHSCPCPTSFFTAILPYFVCHVKNTVTNAMKCQWFG